MTKTRLFEVRDGKSFIGTYRATSPAHAMQRAKDEQNITAGAFRKSQPAVKFTNLRATEIAPR